MGRIQVNLKGKTKKKEFLKRKNKNKRKVTLIVLGLFHSIFLKLQCGFTGFYLLAVHVQNEHKTTKIAPQILIMLEKWVNIC